MMNLFNKKIHRNVLFVFVVLVILLVPVVSHAYSLNPINAVASGFIMAWEYIQNMIITFIGLLIQTITALIMGIAGVLLEWVIQYTVVEMSGHINDIGAINVAWAAFRDLANMVFIFILLYVAIGTILNLSSINTKKMIVNVVIIGLLINFSLFFTKIIIDASNILAIGFYQNIAGTTAGFGLGVAFIAKMHLVGIYSFETIKGVEPLQNLMIQLGGAAFMITAACVFFAVALLFIIRFLVLIFLMILSPLAFASMALPKDEYSKKWWDALLSQCIFAPAFMALIWVSYQLLDGVVYIPPSSQTSITDIFTSDQYKNALPLVFNFLVIIGMMIFSLVVAKSFASKSAGSLMKVASWAQGKAGRAMVRGTGMAYLDRKFGDSAFGKSSFGRTLRGGTTAKFTSHDFGDGKSVQKVDKEEKKLNEEYGKKLVEDSDKIYAKQMQLKRDKELPGVKLDSQRHANDVNTHTAAKEGAENDLSVEVLTGTAYGKKELNTARSEVAKMQADVDNGVHDPTGRRAQEMKLRIDKIAHTENLMADVIEHEEKKQKSEKALVAAQTRIREIEDEAPASTEEEKRGLRAMREARASELENNAFGIPGLGIQALSPKHAFNFLPEGTLKDFAKNLIPQRDVDAGIKEFRNAQKGKGAQSPEAKLQAAITAAAAAAAPPPPTTP